MDLDGIEMHPIFFQLGWNLDGDWPIRRQNPYQHQFVNVNNNNYTCCAKMAGKEETPTCRKKTVTWTNEMIEDLIDFIEIHPIVAFEAIYEPILTSFWSLISFAVQLYIIMQYKGKHPPLLPEMPFCLLYLPPKLVCIHQNFLHRVYTNLNSSFLDPSFLEWRLGCKTCIVYTGLKTSFHFWRPSDLKQILRYKLHQMHLNKQLLIFRGLHCMASEINYLYCMTKLK